MCKKQENNYHKNDKMNIKRMRKIESTRQCKNTKIQKSILLLEICN